MRHQWTSTCSSTRQLCPSVGDSWTSSRPAWQTAQCYQPVVACVPDWGTDHVGTTHVVGCAYAPWSSVMLPSRHARSSRMTWVVQVRRRRRSRWSSVADDAWRRCVYLLNQVADLGSMLLPPVDSWHQATIEACIETMAIHKGHDGRHWIRVTK